jgi:hypothetical protein
MRHAALMPVPEVDMDDDWRPSTVMTATASFSGEA